MSQSNDSNVKKTINIGQDLINPYKKRGAKKSIKVRNPSTAAKTFKLTSTKRELLNRIKEKREEERRKNNALNIVLNTKEGKTLTSAPQNKNRDLQINQESFESGFQDALKYLDMVRQQHREKKAKKKQRRDLGKGIVMTVGGNPGGSVKKDPPTTLSPPVSTPRTLMSNSVPTNPVSPDNVIVVDTNTNSSSSSSSLVPSAVPAVISGVSQPAVVPAVVQPAVVPAVVQPAVVPAVVQPAVVPAVVQPAVVPSVVQPATVVPAAPQQVNTSVPHIHAPAPPYGNLKGGKLPTYRRYHHTMKNIKHSNGESNKNNSIQKIKSGKRRSKPSRKRREVKRKTVKRTYHLGRNKENNQLSVLIKNQEKNNKIKHEENIIKNKSIDEVKKYLFDKNMIKIGTSAPEVILRKMYETSILAGDITNKNPKIRLHNFTSYGAIQ